MMSAYFISFWPAYLLAIVFVVAYLFSLVAWVWAAADLPIDLDWLGQLVAVLTNAEWWAVAAPRFVDQSPFVLGSSLAIIVGLGAAVLAVQSADVSEGEDQGPASIEDRLVRAAVAVAAVAAGWAWIGLPSVAVKDADPVAALASGVVAFLISLLTAAFSLFLRGRKQGVRQLERRLQRRRARLRLLGDRGYRRSWTANAIIFGWLAVPVAVASFAHWGIFSAANQGGVRVIVSFNVALGFTMWIAGIALAWPMVSTSIVARAWQIFGKVVAAITICTPSVLLVIKAIRATQEEPDKFGATYVLWAGTYVVWAALMLCGFWPARAKSEDGAHPTKPKPHCVLAGRAAVATFVRRTLLLLRADTAIRDLRIQLNEDVSRTIEAQIVSRTVGSAGTG